MSPDEYQQAWQAHSSRTRVTIDADSLLTAIQRSQKQARAALTWNDYGSILIYLVLLPAWIYLGVALASPWTWYLMVPAIVWGSAFSLLMRARRKRASTDPGDSLLGNVQETLNLVEHQIWTQRKSFWWTQFPMALAMLAFFVHSAWLHSDSWLDALATALFTSAIVVAFYAFIGYMNRYVVRRQHEPRRRELRALLESLREEPNGEVSGEYPILMKGPCAHISRRRSAIALVCAAILFIIALGCIEWISRLADRLPDKSPFTAFLLKNREQEKLPAVSIDDAELFRARIDEFLNAAHNKAGFSGAVIVARAGKPVYQGAFGFAHLESRDPNTLDTPFRIASLSKQFTAAAIFRLEGQGKLKIDDPVYQYLPEFDKDPYRKITIHHLLTHTSGLPRTPEDMINSVKWGAMSKTDTPVDDYVRLAVQMPLNFEPGSDYEYSNFGYRVLSALIARLTGMAYADYMEQEVFQPLGMKDSGVARVNRPASENRIAEGLTARKLPFASEPYFANAELGRNFGTGYGSGGIYTTANDLLKWDRVLAGDDFLTASQKERLFQPVHANYACGWIVKESGLDGRLYQMHNGANEGFFSQMMRIPQDDLVIIALGNVDDTAEIDEILDQLFRLCRSLPYHAA